MKSCLKPLIASVLLVSCLAVSISSYSKGFVVSDFQLTIERSGSEVILKCEEGCFWDTLSWTCPTSGDCKWGVDRLGMFRPVSSKSTSEGFQIIVQDSTDHTMKLTCKQGCRWKELTWTCRRPSEACMATIDFNGLSSQIRR